MAETVRMADYSSCHLKNVKPHEAEVTGIVIPWHYPFMAPKVVAREKRPPESEVQAIARRIRMTRAAMGLKPVEICRRAGIAQNTYSQWESAVTAPDRFQARKLKRAFGWTLDWIYEDDPSGLPHHIASKLNPEAA